MPCSNNVLFINRPNSNQSCSVGSGLGPTDPLNKNLLGPRPKRGKVIEQIKDYVLLMLGAPTIEVELDVQHVDLAVDQALMIYEDYAPREYFQYHVFNTTPGKSVYDLPEFIGHVRQVSYKQLATFAFQASDLNGAIPIEYFYPGGSYASIQGGLIDPIQPIWGRAAEWTLFKQYEHQYSKMSSNIGGWEWLGDTSRIKLYPVPYNVQKVIVHYLQKNKDWAQVKQVMQEGALAHAMIILGNIRGKYQNIPGPGGGIVNDGQYMRDKGYELKEKWEQQLLEKYGDIPPIFIG